MKKTKKLVVGNWKMNPVNAVEAKLIARGTKKVATTLKKTQVVICPPYLYIESLSTIVGGPLFLGAQNTFQELTGSFTGEVNFRQLRQAKVSFVIAGHSERRAMGETDVIINKKVRSVVAEGMTAILCVGEKTRDTHGEYLAFIKSQIIAGMKDVASQLLPYIVVAYEPVWAIGGRQAMVPREIHEMCIFIKKVLRELYGVPADSVRILYGGSVTSENVGDIMKDGFLQGVLVGHESVVVKDFVHIIKTVDSQS